MRTFDDAYVLSIQRGLFYRLEIREACVPAGLRLTNIQKQQDDAERRADFYFRRMQEQ